MNRLAFQTYGTKKLSIFQSVWDTTKNSVVSTTELANIAATTPLPVGWAGTNLLTGGYTHTAGNTASLLVNNLTPTAGQSYQVICTISSGSTGSVIINWGGMSSVAISATTTITLTPINTTSKLSITPSNDFAGTVLLSIKQSSSAANQIQLPITVASGKSVWVDWGDGQYSTANSTNYTANRIHTYAASGEYPVRVFGDDFAFGFSNPVISVNDRLKIKSISSWGKLKIGASSFNGCSNVIMSGITDVPDLTVVTSLDSTFAGCSAITTVGRMNEWNTSGITNMYSMFFNAINFNQNIGSWNVSNVGIMHYMFYGTTAFNQSLSNWERIGSTLSSVTNMSFMFLGATAFNNGFASGVANQLPWNINTTAASVLMTNMFQSATAFNSNLGTGTTPWDVSKVTTFASMFSGASNFRNGDEVTQSKINDWNIGGSVTAVSMASMFQSASVFNRDISSWNVSKVTNTSNMFQSASAFNQNLSNWERVSSPDTSTLENVTNMVFMFYLATAFNNGLAVGLPGTLTWNTSGVTNFQQMFQNASAFNCNVGGFNVNACSNFIFMFRNCSSFNNGNNASIGNWILKPTGFIAMNAMFQNALPFNQPIGSWNVSRVTNMSLMFSNSAFNQSIGSWDVGNVTDMDSMFSSTGFNQNIGSWNVSKVTSFSNFMSGKTPANFSSTNLDAIYNSWSSLPSVKPNINISFGTAKYSQAGKPGKDTLLTSPNNWTIADGLLTVSGTSNNGGLIRVTTTSAHGFVTGNSVYIYGVGGTTNANGTWTVTNVNTTVIELQGSTYNAAWTSGGNIILP